MADVMLTPPGTDETAPPDPAASRSARRSRERGQGLTEYGLVLMIVAIGIVVASQVLGAQATTLFDNISNGLRVASGG